MEVTWIDAGGKIDAGAMVVSEVLYLDYKAPVPLWFDKIVVKEVVSFNNEIMGKVMDEVLPSLIKDNGIVMLTTDKLLPDSFYGRCVSDEDS